MTSRRKLDQQYRKRAGLTLLELLVCLVVMAILASASAPALRRPLPPAVGDRLLTSECRRAALRGADRTIRLHVGGVERLATCYADGALLIAMPPHPVGQ